MIRTLATESCSRSNPPGSPSCAMQLAHRKVGACEIARVLVAFERSLDEACALAVSPVFALGHETLLARASATSHHHPKNPRRSIGTGRGSLSQVRCP